jgi:hypothetical protein
MRHDATLFLEGRAGVGGPGVEHARARPFLFGVRQRSERVDPDDMDGPVRRDQDLRLDEAVPSADARRGLGTSAAVERSRETEPLPVRRPRDVDTAAVRARRLGVRSERLPIAPLRARHERARPRLAVVARAAERDHVPIRVVDRAGGQRVGGRVEGLERDCRDDQIAVRSVDHQRVSDDAVGVEARKLDGTVGPGLTAILRSPAPDVAPDAEPDGRVGRDRGHAHRVVRVDGDVRLEHPRRARGRERHESAPCSRHRVALRPTTADTCATTGVSRGYQHVGIHYWHPMIGSSTVPAGYPLFTIGARGSSCLEDS